MLDVFKCKKLLYNMLIYNDNLLAGAQVLEKWSSGADFDGKLILSLLFGLGFVLRVKEQFLTRVNLWQAD